MQNAIFLSALASDTESDSESALQHTTCQGLPVNAQSNNLRNKGRNAASFNFATSSTNAATTERSTCIKISAIAKCKRAGVAYTKNIYISPFIPEVKSLEENFEGGTDMFEHRWPRCSANASSEQLEITNYMLLREKY